MYELTTGGDYPYELEPSEKNPYQMFRDAHLHARKKYIGSFADSLIDTCLEKKKENRYQNFKELKNDLMGFSNLFKISIPDLTWQVQHDGANLYAKAQSYMAIGYELQALEAINRYVTLYPDNYCGWTEKGRIHLERDEPELSISATLASIDRFPRNSHAWNNLGVAYIKLEDWGKASDAFIKSLKSDPHNTGAMMQFALSLVNLHRNDEAISWLIKALD